jgi:hypothetical protein
MSNHYRECFVTEIRKPLSKTAYAMLAAGLIVAPLGNAAPPLSGAIFTTDSTGAIVNGNTKYTSKCGPGGVWLDGGPPPNAPSTAAGLPDGDYYFQVTDPSGKKLLSNDPVQDRCVTVSGGVIVSNCSTGTHPTNASVDAGGGVVVELCGPPADNPTPFDDTPNNGGVYKAWMTPVGDFVGDVTQVDNSCGNGCFHGFIPAASKTDNFKVNEKEPTFCLDVYKDILDAKKGTVPASGWEMCITDYLGVTNCGDTDGQGLYEVCGLTAGTYTVEETELPGYVIYSTSVNGVVVGATTSASIMWTKGKQDPQVVEFTNEVCDTKGCPNP